MDRLDELEERVTTLENCKASKIVKIDSDSVTTIRFVSSSYHVDVEIDVMSQDKVNIVFDINGTSEVINSNYIYKMVKTDRVNTMTIDVKGALLSKKVRIEGIGVRLLSA